MGLIKPVSTSGISIGDASFKKEVVNNFGEIITPVKYIITSDNQIFVEDKVTLSLEFQGFIDIAINFTGSGFKMYIDSSNKEITGNKYTGYVENRIRLECEPNTTITFTKCNKLNPNGGIMTTDLLFNISKEISNLRKDYFNIWLRIEEEHNSGSLMGE